LHGAKVVMDREKEAEIQVCSEIIAGFYKKADTMETINNIVLRDETVYPDENVLHKVLGRSFKAYTLLFFTYISLWGHPLNLPVLGYRL